MKYPAYPQYKDSGVAWLGEVPEDWDIRPIKAIVSTPVTDGPHETPEIIDEGVPFVSAEAINGGKINFDRIRGYISEEDHRRFSKKYKPQFGDLYMVKSGATTGRVAMVETEEEFNIWSPLAAIRCNPNKVERKFLYFYLQSKEFQTGVELSWSFGTQQNIGMGVIQNLSVPISSLNEQTAIADFLDRETGRIDTLVAKKRKLLELLKEKRSALISRTVTRGLPADAEREFGLITGNAAVHEAPGAYDRGHKNQGVDENFSSCRGEKFFAPTECNGIPGRLKDSGVEWLGEIPTHWRQTQIKHIAQVRQGVTKGRDLAGKEIIELPYLRVANVQDGYLDLSEISTIPVMENEIKRYSLKQGDVLMNEGGDNDKLGRGTVWNEEIPICLHQNHVFSVRPFDIKLSAWIALWTQGAAAKSYFLLRGKQTTNLASISSTSIRELPIIIPPDEEQTAIATYLDRETAKIDRLVAKVETAITRLQEYRSALITAAVTGKIDVREAR